jgi:hypothetical protein
MKKKTLPIFCIIFWLTAFVTQSPFSSRITGFKFSSISCPLERKTKSGNEAGNGTTETGIDTHGEVGAVDLTGVKVEEGLVDHVVRTEILTKTETDEEGQVCLPIYNYIFVLIYVIDKRDRDYRRDRPDDRRGDPRGDRERDRRGDRRRDRGDDRRELPRRDDRDGPTREDRKHESKAHAPSKSDSGPAG